MHPLSRHFPSLTNECTLLEIHSFLSLNSPLYFTILREWSLIKLWKLEEMPETKNVLQIICLDNIPVVTDLRERK